MIDSMERAPDAGEAALAPDDADRGRKPVAPALVRTSQNAAPDDIEYRCLALKIGHHSFQKNRPRPEHLVGLCVPNPLRPRRAPV
jgi:hypothetical protein